MYRVQRGLLLATCDLYIVKNILRFTFYVLRFTLYYSRLDQGYTMRLQVLQKRPGRLDIELRVGGLDAQEEVAARGQLEARHVEERVVWLGQAVERQHAENRR